MRLQCQFLLALAVVTCCGSLTAANPPEIRELSTASVTRSSVRVTWQTDVDATRELEWGVQAFLFPNRTKFGGRGVNHSLFLSGLASDTTYYVRACSEDTSRACSAAQSFRTAPAIAAVAEIAQQPRETPL